MSSPCRSWMLGVLLAGAAASSVARAQAPTSEQARPGGDARAWQRLVGLLQYLQSDYPMAVASGDEAELAEQRAFAQEAVDAARELGAAAAAFVPRLEALSARIERSDDPTSISRDCGALVDDLVLAGALARSPRQPPDLERGRALYENACAACHGPDGGAKTEVGRTMDPPPASFLSAEVMDGLTPFKAFNTISFGVTGTAMPSFAVLDEQDRWALAFHLFTLRQPTCRGAAPRTTLEELSTTPDAELARRFGPGALACLRRTSPRLDEERSLLAAREGIERALALAAEGKPVAARQAVLDAYLEGLEPVEPLLRARDPQLIRDLETGFNRTRLALERGSPHAADEGREVLALVDQARRAVPSAGDFWSVFWMAVAILLREGFEATVVIAALLAVLKKMEAPQYTRVVHAGWGSAIALGAVLFFFAREVLAGANREWVEGVMSLFAVAMLLYAALWLNARANIRKFMGDLRARMTGALGRGNVMGLFAIAFTAMLRESVETAIFLQGLSIDSRAGVVWGAAAGLAVLLVLVAIIHRVGYRLPMKALFNASTVMLVATAVVLCGKGLRALQEVGALPLQPLRFAEVDFLGIYPDAYTLLPQLLLALAPIAWLLLRRAPAPPPPPVATSSTGAPPRVGSN